MDMIRGQKLKIADVTSGASQFVVNLQLVSPLTIDVSCFGVDGQGKLSDERYMTFFNQPQSPCGGVKFVNNPNNQSSFQIDLTKIPASIDKLVFTAAIDGTGTMAQLQASSLTINQGSSCRFAFSGQDFAAERALMVAEIYRKEGVWRIAAVGQGFNGGLEALVKHFGGEVAASVAPPPPVIEPPKPAAPPPAAPKVSLSKVTLQKSGDKISLEKAQSQSYGKIKVNLNWHRQTQKTGFFGFGSQKIDLDVGCMYEKFNGDKGVIQAIGKSFGRYQQEPYIQLEGDDRTGAAVNGENLLINGDHFEQFKRILVFAFIYEGVPNWAATDGVVTITIANQPPVEVRLDRADSKGMCAIAMIENVRGQLTVTKLVEYFHGHPDMDKWFGFGFNWKAGSK